MESWTNRSNGPSETGVQTLVEGQCESKSDNSGPTILVFLKHPLMFLGRQFFVENPTYCANQAVHGSLIGALFGLWES